MVAHRHSPPLGSLPTSLPSVVLATLSMLGMGAPLEARADPVRLLTFIEVRSDAATSAHALLRQYAQMLRGGVGAEPIEVQVLQQIDRPEHFVLLESSDRPELLLERERLAQPTLQSITMMLTAPLDRRLHRSFGPACASGTTETVSSADSAQSAQLSAGHEAIYVIAHLDIAGPVGDAPRAALERLSTAACHAAGNELFAVWQQSDRGNHFNLVARWSSRGAHSAFSASTAAREFREIVGPRLGSPYDERIYQPATPVSAP
jgi:quinol monooxygenase YgiN